MKTYPFCAIAMLMFLLPLNSHADGAVFRYTIDRPLAEIYDGLYSTMEQARFFIVLEPDIGKNLAGFAERWGEDYNRNGLDAIRSLVFCNGWYANQVGNLDPDMLSLCPQHLTLIEKNGKTTALYARPTFVAASSPARQVLDELENEVIAAIKKGMQAGAPDQ